MTPRLLVCLVLLAASVLPASPAAAGTVSETREGATLIKAIEGADCRTSLERRDGSDYLRFRDSCGLPLDGKIAALAALAAAFETGRDFPGGVRSLGLGRLVRWPDLARALALAAYRSPDWDAAAGKPRQVAATDARALHGFVVTLARGEALFDSLLAPFAADGVSLEGLSIEKVLVGRPDQTPFGDWLLAQGVSADAKVPFDAITWLVLEREEQ